MFVKMPRMSVHFFWTEVRFSQLGGLGLMVSDPLFLRGTWASLNENQFVISHASISSPLITNPIGLLGTSDGLIC